MDVISVDEASLKQAICNLEKLAQDANTITLRLESDCNSVKSGLDETLQRDVSEFTDSTKSYNQMILKYVSENIQALRERLAKLDRYSSL